MNITTWVNLMIGRIFHYVARISAFLFATKGGVCPKVNMGYLSE
jgi:hypothetical protein